MSSRLELRGVHAGYDGATVLHGIDLTVTAGRVTCLLGANGAGKSTAARVAAGLLAPARGTVRLDGEDITRLPAHRRVPLGVVMVPEGRHLFTELPVRDNLTLGGYRRTAAERRADLDRVLDLFPQLAALLRRPAGDLSGGEQQMLALGRALMARPRLLVLDEPTLALSPLLARTILDRTRDLADGGVGVLLVEQSVTGSLQVADTAIVLENGRTALSGPVAAVRDDPRVVASYLGGVV
ncbi:ABC transporter ATP-binding protein [Actinomadura chibensis]|uniref:ABC transporter ATP-binding protein n=1 Tax=Actinomadura chibensis TaxID=392828 RepID=A0A5D0N9F1_9ACTN|nr:ABC transporter ATP-binding protein [Actinomadura chibensis]TYB41060.1 ABC transporter ATP-binding protein [Actinomadura chibensis]